MLRKIPTEILVLLRSQGSPEPRLKAPGESLHLQHQEIQAAQKKRRKVTQNAQKTTPKLVLVICKCQWLALRRDFGKCKLQAPALICQSLQPWRATGAEI